jgi:hypothetical protein
MTAKCIHNTVQNTSLLVSGDFTCIEDVSPVSNDMYTIDEGKRKGRERYGAFPECGPLAKDSAAKLTVHTVYVRCNLPPPPSPHG